MPQSVILIITILIVISAGQTNFVAVGADVTLGNGRNIAYSTDGITWTIVPTNIFSVRVYDVAYSSILNTWMAVGQGTVNTLGFSNDGMNWTGL